MGKFDNLMGTVKRDVWMYRIREVNSIWNKYQSLGRALQMPLLTYYLEFSQISQNKK